MCYIDTHTEPQWFGARGYLVKDVGVLRGCGGTLFCVLFGFWLVSVYSGGAEKQMSVPPQHWL